MCLNSCQKIEGGGDSDSCKHMLISNICIDVFVGVCISEWMLFAQGPWICVFVNKISLVRVQLCLAVILLVPTTVYTRLYLLASSCPDQPDMVNGWICNWFWWFLWWSAMQTWDAWSNISLNLLKPPLIQENLMRHAKIRQQGNRYTSYFVFQAHIGPRWIKHLCLLSEKSSL